MHARLDKWGAFFTVRMHVGTPAVLAQAGASLSFDASLSVHADPCNFRAIVLEFSTQMTLSVRDNNSCKHGNIVDCIMQGSSATSLWHGTDSFLRCASSPKGGFSNSQLCQSLILDIPNVRKTLYLPSGVSTLHLRVSEFRQPDLENVMALLGTDIELSVTPHTIRSAFNGVEFELHGAITLLDSSKMSMALPRNYPQVVLKTGHLPIWNLVTSVAQIMIPSEVVMPQPRFITPRLGKVTIGEMDMLCSAAVLSSTLTITGVVLQPMAPIIEQAFSRAINAVRSHLARPEQPMLLPDCTRYSDSHRGVEPILLCAVEIVQLVTVPHGTQVRFNTYPAAGLNAGGVNAMLKHAIESNRVDLTVISPSTRVVYASVRGLELCTASEKVGQHCVVKHRKRGSARSLLSDFGVVDTEDECSSSSFIVLAGFVLGGMFIIFSDLVGRFWSHCKVSCAVGSHVTPADVVPDRGDFYSQVRTLDKFRKGQNLGGSPVPIFFHRYSSRNKELMSTVMRGVVGKTWKQAILNALIAGMLEWGLFYVKHCKKEYFPALELWFAGAMRVESAVLSVVSFLIAMYVEGRMAKHQDITKSCWALRGHLINLSVCLGSVIDNDEINTVNKFRMYRYLTLAHVYFYKTICQQQMDVFDDEHWLSKNILEPQELEWLKQARLPAESILCWLTNAITTNPATNEEADGYTRTQLAKRLVLIRAGASALMDTCSWLPPVSWAQLISVMVELLVAVTPVALVMRRANETEASYVWGMLGAACQALFFQGLINMVVIVEDPFGDDLDDLNPDGLLVKTEQQIQSCLI
jgi:predicted membrane chloride channel (bestrophin family)